MTTTLADFRSTLTADDRTGWLIFADWLDDRGDKRWAWVRRFAEDEARIVKSDYGFWVHYDSVVSYLSGDGARDFYMIQRDDTPLDALLALADACIAAEAEREKVAE